MSRHLNRIVARVKACHSVPQHNRAEPHWVYDFSGLSMSADRIFMSAKCANPGDTMRIIDGCVSIVGEDHHKVENPPDPNTDSGTW